VLSVLAVSSCAARAEGQGSRCWVCWGGEALGSSTKRWGQSFEPHMVDMQAFGFRPITQAITQSAHYSALSAQCEEAGSTGDDVFRCPMCDVPAVPAVPGRWRWAWPMSCAVCCLLLESQGRQ
jgi:hypothetical protein